MNCLNCGNTLRPGASFCARCGQLAPAASSPPHPSPPVHQPTQPAPSRPSPPVHQPPQPAPSYAPPVAQQPQPPPATYGAQPPMQPMPPGAPVGQLGATRQTVSIWGPFAGYGTRREHVAWLLEGLGHQAEELRDTITDRFARRQIPDAQVQLTNMTGQGIAIEQRPFYRIQRGLATVWLYVARFGQDLYISQVSYIKGPLSILRLLLAGALIAIVGLAMINGIVTYLDIESSVSSLGPFGGGSSPSGSLIISLLCCTGPLGLIALLVLELIIVFSIYKFLTEKDILALFRPPPNEFQEDDIVALEKAVNETVRQSADMIGIDLKLLAPGQAHRSGRRLM